MTWRSAGSPFTTEPPRHRPPPSTSRITAAAGGDLRFTWQGAPGAVRHHTLHRLLPDGTRRFLGGDLPARPSMWPGSYPNRASRQPRFELRAVGELYTASTPVTADHRW